MQLNLLKHGSDGDKLEEIQRSEVPEPLGKASLAEEEDKRSSMCLAWLNNNTGCGGAHDN